VIGLAKERELETGSAPDRIYRRNVKDSIALRPNSPELYVLARIRDEAHRFANSFHRARRSKATLQSELDAIPGVGATRRQRLRTPFGSVRAIRQATIEDLAKAPGMNRKVAEEVARFFVERTTAEIQAAVPPAEAAAPPPRDGWATAVARSRKLKLPSAADGNIDANVEGRVGDPDLDAEVSYPDEVFVEDSGDITAEPALVDLATDPGPANVS
jgi:excinuclease ABC subunit C